MLAIFGTVAQKKKKAFWMSKATPSHISVRLRLMKDWETGGGSDHPTLHHPGLSYKPGLQPAVADKVHWHQCQRKVSFTISTTNICRIRSKIERRLSLPISLLSSFFPPVYFPHPLNTRILSPDMASPARRYQIQRLRSHYSFSYGYCNQGNPKLNL